MSNKTRKFKCISIHGTKSFLLRCENGYLLIDTVYPGTYDLFAKGLKKHGVDIREIKFLLLTHHHYDHAGLAHQIIEETGARLIVHRNEVASLAEGAVRRSKCTSIWASVFWRIFCLFAKFDYHPVKVKEADYVLGESTYGDRLHESSSDVKGKLCEIINSTVEKGGNVIIPSFAIERTQENWG